MHDGHMMVTCMMVAMNILITKQHFTLGQVDMDNGYVRRMYSDVCSKLTYGDVYVYVYVILNCTVGGAQSWLG